MVIIFVLSMPYFCMFLILTQSYQNIACALNYVKKTVGWFKNVSYGDFETT